VQPVNQDRVDQRALETAGRKRSTKGRISLPGFRSLKRMQTMRRGLAS